jgi:enamine deaminase RidA (YjgF/YER057c/UK114 family)
MEAIKPAHFPWFDYSRYTFSLGLKVGERAYLSGHSASEYDAADRHILVKGGMAEQTRTAYAKIAAILEAAGLDLSQASRVVENVTSKGIEHYAEAEGVRAEVFGAHTPAVCTVVVDALLRPAALIEVEVQAGPSGAGITVDGYGRVAAAPAFEVDGVVYLSSLTASEAGADLVSQTRAIFEKAARILDAAGLSMAAVVKSVDYSTPATLDQYKGTGRVRKEFLSAPYPGAAGILLSKLQTPDTLTSIDFIASRAPLEAINPGWERYTKLTYSPAVKAGNVLFMSGQAALDPTTERALFADDVVAQAEYTYANIIEVLKAAGAGPQNLVKTIEYVTPAGLANYREVAKVREKVLREPYPASTGAICAALLRPEFQIEIDPLAIL